LTSVSEVGGEVACDLGHPLAVGVDGDTEDVDDASLQFDYEQYVLGAEQRGVDTEEVSGDGTFGLGREELSPGRTFSSGNSR
jgi:hypothetical protein